MRENKYRAWNRNEGKYSLPFTFSSLLSDIAWYDISEVWLRYGAGLGDYWTLHEPYFEDEEWSLQRYTGLLDKNNVEIFEGDILSIPHLVSDENGTTYSYLRVDWRGEGFVAIDEDGVAERLSYLTNLTWQDTGQRTCEVAGNIYENADLLGRN